MPRESLTPISSCTSMLGGEGDSDRQTKGTRGADGVLGEDEEVGHGRRVGTLLRTLRGGGQRRRGGLVPGYAGDAQGRRRADRRRPLRRGVHAPPWLRHAAARPSRRGRG